jgi:hypothetical protein
MARLQIPRLRCLHKIALREIGRSSHQAGQAVLHALQAAGNPVQQALEVRAFVRRFVREFRHACRRWLRRGLR